MRPEEVFEMVVLLLALGALVVVGNRVVQRLSERVREVAR